MGGALMRRVLCVVAAALKHDPACKTGEPQCCVCSWVQLVVHANQSHMMNRAIHDRRTAVSGAAVRWCPKHPLACAPRLSLLHCTIMARRSTRHALHPGLRPSPLLDLPEALLIRCLSFLSLRERYVIRASHGRHLGSSRRLQPPPLCRRLRSPPVSRAGAAASRVAACCCTGVQPAHLPCFRHA